MTVCAAALFGFGQFTDGNTLTCFAWGVSAEVIVELVAAG
jgi:hypothetical protein